MAQLVVEKHDLAYFIEVIQTIYLDLFCLWNLTHATSRIA